MDVVDTKFFKAILVANSFLHFYSTEFLKTTTVDRILHNWALMFAVNGVKADSTKKHLENLQSTNFYCTSAIPKHVETKSYLLNPVPEHTTAGALSLMRVEKFLPGSEFEFLIMSKNGNEPPNIISYGKKKSHHTLLYEELKVKSKHMEQANISPKRLVNPLDFKKIDEITFARKHPMRPSPLYDIDGRFHDVFVLPQFKEVFPCNFPYSEWMK